MNKRKGFTLIELLVVVLIIGILAAMALPAYFKAVERTRIAEADQLLGSIAQAQQRRYMKTNSYSTLFSGLDVSPTMAAQAGFCTKTPSAATEAACVGNGFWITLDATNASDFDKGHVVAKRVNNNEYTYSLQRAYQSTEVTCTGEGAAGEALCADYCGVDQVDDDGQCCSSGAHTNGKGAACGSYVTP